VSMSIAAYTAIAIVAYLLGSIPFGLILMKLVRGQDVRLSGSGNIGATNVVRSGAKGLGIATLVLDALKGALAVWIASAVAHSHYNICGTATLGGFDMNLPCVLDLRLMSLAALAAILGHMFPVWLKFKGGKGVATALGAFALLIPVAILVSLAVFVVAVAITRYVSVGSILGAIVFPVAAYFLRPEDLYSLVPVCLAAIFIVMKHRQNIGRLLAGKENRLGGKKSQSAEKPS